jgi:hypothetical protein
MGGLEAYNTIGRYGCLFTAVVNIGNTEKERTGRVHPRALQLSDGKALNNAMPLRYYAENKEYFNHTWNEGTQEFDMLMDAEKIKLLLEDMTGGEYLVTKILGNEKSIKLIKHYANALTGVYIIADVGGHFVNVIDIIVKDGREQVQVFNPLKNENAPEFFETGAIVGIYLIKDI